MNYFLIKLRNAYFLGGIEKRIHDNFNIEFINFIEKRFNLVFSFNIFMEQNKAGSAGGLHALNIQLIIIVVNISHEHIGLLLTAS